MAPVSDIHLQRYPYAQRHEVLAHLTAALPEGITPHLDHVLRDGECVVLLRVIPPEEGREVPRGERAVERIVLGGPER